MVFPAPIWHVRLVACFHSSHAMQVNVGLRVYLGRLRSVCRETCLSDDRFAKSPSHFFPASNTATSEEGSDVVREHGSG